MVQRNLQRIGAAGGQGAQFAQFVRSAGFTVNVRPLRALLAGDHTQTLLLLQLAVALVLLIASANIANLLLTRLSARQKELSVRSALGAGRSRIARQLLIEALLLALIGAAIGLGVALAGQRLIGMSGLLPDWVSLGLDLRVLLFTLALATGAGLLFGLFPVLSAGTARPQQVLRESGRLGSGGRAALATRNTLVVVQLALAVALLASAGLLARSFAKVMHQSPGFDANGVLTAAVSLASGKYPNDGARARIAGAQFAETDDRHMAVVRPALHDRRRFTPARLRGVAHGRGTEKRLHRAKRAGWWHILPGLGLTRHEQRRCDEHFPDHGCDVRTSTR